MCGALSLCAEVPRVIRPLRNALLNVQTVLRQPPCVERHTFRVYAVAGTLRSGSAQYVWTVMYPAPRITAHPASRTRSRTATFRFTYGTRGVTFKCRLD